METIKNKSEEEKQITKEKIKSAWIDKSEEEKQEIINKRKETINSKSEEEKQEKINKFLISYHSRTEEEKQLTKEKLSRVKKVHAKKGILFDATGNIISHFYCNINDLCKEFNISSGIFRKSYINKGEPFYLKTKIKSDKYSHSFGWFALLEEDLYLKDSIVNKLKELVSNNLKDFSSNFKYCLLNNNADIISKFKGLSDFKIFCKEHYLPSSILIDTYKNNNYANSKFKNKQFINGWCLRLIS